MIDGSLEVVMVIAALAVERHRALDEIARLRAENERLKAELEAAKKSEAKPEKKAKP